MAKRGGKRAGAGRKKTRAENFGKVNKNVATQVLLLTEKPIHGTEKEPCRCELCKWWNLLHKSGDSRLEFDVLKYLTDKRDGKAVQTVNHIHDKPIEMNVTLSLAEAVQKARKRVLGQ